MSIIKCLFFNKKFHTSAFLTTSRVFFNVKGVKQGSTLSPKLFAIFINDLPEYLEKRWAPVVHLGNNVLSLLLFADDIALFARSNSELQTLLDLKAEYLEENKLEINTKQTVVMIFCRRQSTGNKDEGSFNLNGEAVKVVSQAIYLGFHLTSNGRWSNHISKMANRGKAAMATLFRNSNLTGIGDLKMHKNVFNSKIRPILHYGGEVWGLEVANALETLQLQYYKRMLGLHATTHTLFIKGDLGLFSMRKHRQIQLIRFWRRILQCPSSRLIRAAYDELSYPRTKIGMAFPCQKTTGQHRSIVCMEWRRWPNLRSKSLSVRDPNKAGRPRNSEIVERP